MVPGVTDMKSSSVNPGIPQIVVLIVFGLLAILPHDNAQAQFNGHNLRGDFGLFSGSQPGPGWYAGFLGVSYEVDLRAERLRQPLLLPSRPPRMR